MTVKSIFQGGIYGNTKQTQNLYERMVIDSIQIMGQNVYYIPRTWVNVDTIFTEDSLATFNGAFPIEMYMDNVQGFGGQDSFLSKFCIEVNSTCTFTVSKLRWNKEVGRSGQAVLVERPTEGDLLYLPVSGTLFEIRKVDALNPFYQLGKQYTWKMDCEVFQYGSERMDTGIDGVDNNPYLYSVAEEDYELLLLDGTNLLFQTGDNLVMVSYSLDIIDPGSQNTVFETEADPIIVWSSDNPFAELAS